MKYLSFKNSILLFLIAVLAGLSGILTSCVKQKFDTPPVIVPHVDFPSNATIDSLYRYYNLKPHGTNPDTLQIRDDIIIQGVVNSTDLAGNVYKNLYIQSQISGLTLTVEQSGLNATYKVGQRVFIKCKGLYLGTYGGMVELGYGVYENPTSHKKSIGRIPANILASHVFLDSLPSNSIAPKVINPKNTTPDLKNFLGMLVEVQDVKFPEAISTPGIMFVDNPTSTGSASSRLLADSQGTTLTYNGQNFIVRTSNYADFAGDKLPSGTGTILGILTSYNGQYQMTIRDKNDIVNFH